MSTSELSRELSDDSWVDLVHHLSDLSVRKNYDAFIDVPWDEHPIDADDPRWALDSGIDPISETDWYRSLTPTQQSRLGLHNVVLKAKLGLQFELILMQGLLRYVADLPNGSPEMRYALHEVIEEGQHVLMFQELVNRSGIDVGGLTWRDRLGTPFVISWGRRFPELFMIFVLGGEDPIDHVQRKLIRSGTAHPLLERIMWNHVAEEARHLSFARGYLRRQVPKLSKVRRTVLALMTPIVLSEMSKMMLRPHPELVRAHNIPADAIRQAYVDNPEAKAGRIEAVGKVRKLCRELGLMTPLAKVLWRRAGVWSDDLD